MPDFTRLEMLKDILVQDPTNKLARYGLAMEYSSAGETDESVAEFQKLIEQDPLYANAYFMAAQTLHKAERTDEAKEMLGRGINAAQRSGNKHAEGEMQAMMDELEIGY
jgi:tetratricopeptide (TPR) repeat protein